MSRMMSGKSGNPSGLIMHSGLRLNCSRNNRSYFLLPDELVEENVSEILMVTDSYDCAEF